MQVWRVGLSAKKGGRKICAVFCGWIFACFLKREAELGFKCGDASRKVIDAENKSYGVVLDCL